MAKPSSASLIEGASTSARLIVPYFSSAWISPATVPGTPADARLNRAFSLSTSPSAPMNRSRVAALGAISR
jgi:hypothetical protein